MRFRTGALRHFSPLPETVMTDTCLSPIDIWGKPVAELEQRLCEAANTAAQVQLIERFLLQQLALNKKSSHLWLDEVVNRMYYRHRSVTQGELTAFSGFGARHFQKIFKNHFGIAPKRFQRIIRFEQLTRHLLLNRQQDYLSAVLDYGYYDQSHFIKDFKFFIGASPSGFLHKKL